ncbi:MAG: hypothetical protein WCX17_04060 [Parcubacteria group bacterium]|jgi:hypothetical protein
MTKPNAEKKLFGEERLNRLIDNLPHQLADMIVHNLHNHKKGEITEKVLHNNIKEAIDTHIPGIIQAINYWKEKNGIK